MTVPNLHMLPPPPEPEPGAAEGIEDDAVCADGVIVAPPTDPMPCAAMFLDDAYGARDGHRLLVCHGGLLYRWDGAVWTPVEDAAVRSALWRYFRDALYEVAGKAGPEVKRWSPNRHKVADLLEALRGITFLSRDTTSPSWLDEHPPFPADETVSCTNGLLHWPSRTLHPHTPGFYAHHGVPFAFDPDAPAPKRWNAFLHEELWPDDPAAIQTLHEILGYVISGDTSLQKMFLLVGPKRSGKGTIARVLAGLIGAHNVAGPTLSGLATNFGLQPLIGKPAAIVSDARLRSGQDALVERLLSVTGEDTLTVDRKYLEPWTGRLPSRFVILTNELPRLADTSGALASRFVVLQTERSFYDAEDPGLTDELRTELPGIFNLALDGLASLRARGRFAPPASSGEAVRELEDLASPIGAFVRDRCQVGPAEHETAVQMFAGWKSWCDDNGHDRPGSVQTFGRDLRAAVPGLRISQPRVEVGPRGREYQGIALRGGAL